jgi:hypothetical protein
MPQRQEAAARFATDATRAVECYAALTGRSEQWASGEQEALEEEMLALLPAYRHPVHDASTEYILFVDPAGLPAASSGNAGFPADALDQAPWLRTEWILCLAELARLEAEIAALRRGSCREGQKAAAAALDRDPTVSCFRRQRAYYTYIRLVRGQGFSRQQAVHAVAALFGFPSFAVALQLLKDEQKEVVRRWQKSAPCLMETILARWQGLLPGE